MKELSHLYTLKPQRCLWETFGRETTGLYASGTKWKEMDWTKVVLYNKKHTFSFSLAQHFCYVVPNEYDPGANLGCSRAGKLAVSTGVTEEQDQQRSLLHPEEDQGFGEI